MDCSNAEIQKVSNTSLLWKWFLFVVKGGSGATPKIMDLKGYFVSAAEPSSLLLTAFDRSNADAVSVFCKFVFFEYIFFLYTLYLRVIRPLLLSQSYGSMCFHDLS